jgi:ubiquinone/menaquinone biosynthesis C-methylase UbiE
MFESKVLDKLPIVFKALGDPTRLRVLRLLELAELNVNELVEILESPQPTVSRHLGVLLRAGLVSRRRDGLWTFYSLALRSAALAEDGLGEALRSRLHNAADAAGDRGRLERCLEKRERHSQEFYARIAPTWDRFRAGLDVEGLHGMLLAGVLPGTLDLVDAGTGTGALLPVLAPAARQLIGVDRAPAMLAEARRRANAQGLDRVQLVEADLAHLPLATAGVDGVCSAFALHHAARPPAVLAEFARIVRPGGTVVVSDLVQHHEEWLRDELAHVWLGFDATRVAAWCAEAGLTEVRTATLVRRRPNSGRVMPDVWVVGGRRSASSP